MMNRSFGIVVHASPTINRNYGTFSFAFMNYNKEVERVQTSTGLIPAIAGEN
jgi:chloramphenicol O-acetyltransferase type A